MMPIDPVTLFFLVAALMAAVLVTNGSDGGI